MDFIDYYDELGVQRSSTQPEIKKAYRGLSRKYHPDVNDAPDAEDRFKRIAEAYEVLGDADKRKKYDRYGKAWKAASDGSTPPPGFEGFDFARARRQPGNFSAGGRGFSDFFETFFGAGAGDVFERGGFSPGGGPRPRKGANHQARVSLTLEEAFRGGQREITLTQPRSGGSRKYMVNIPKGVREGQKIRLKGQGEPGASGGPPGDILLEVRYESQSNLRREGDDVHTSLPISPWVAALGGTASLKTLDGTVSVTVPANSSTGRKIRLRGKGFPGKGDVSGNLYAELKIMVPEKLTPRERELFEELADESRFVPDDKN